MKQREVILALYRQEMNRPGNEEGQIAMLMSSVQDDVEVNLELSWNTLSAMLIYMRHASSPPLGADTTPFIAIWER